jgi:hypothetical protein
LSPCLPWAEERLAVAAAEQEGEALQVVAELGDVRGGVAGELFQGGGEAGGVAGQPAGEELQHFGELGCVTGVEVYLGHGFTGFRGGWRGPF